MKRMLGILTAMCILLSMLTPFAMAEEATLPAQNDIYDTVDGGIASAEGYIRSSLEALEESGSIGYGMEWYIIAMLRAGKSLDAGILDAYYASVAATVQTWNTETKPTDIERTALALCIMGKDITDVEGEDIAALIYNNTRLSEGANELAYALLALDAADVVIPDTATWNRTSIVESLLTFQISDGSFGLYGAENGDADVTAICLQALAPYRENTTVAQATENALAFLKTTISDEHTYADNVNTTAQVLLALAVLKVDVTDSANGFGDGESNIITALETYRNPEGDGYIFGTNVNAMATIQVMQAYDAYKKAHAEQVSYWDFPQQSTEEEEPTPPPSVEPTPPPSVEPEPPAVVEPAQPQNVYVTIASKGSVVEDKNGGYVAHAPVRVEDYNEDGHLSVDEALYAAHETYYPGGAAAGYSSYSGPFGLSLAILWGRGSEGTSAVAGYWKNNVSCMSLAEEVQEGDYITAFNYFDAVTWADSYAYFTQNSATVEAGKSVELTLMHLSGYDAENNYAQIFSGCAGAKLMLLGTDTVFAQTTNAEGKVVLPVSASMTPGDYTLVAYKEDHSIVPAVCKFTVTPYRPSSSGSGSSKIKVYIRVADPKGETYLRKKAYSVPKGTTVYELLEETGLKIETTTSPYGLYVSSIEDLAEFDMGSGSGWMFCVNGEFVQSSIDTCKLSKNDYVEVLYTQNYGEDLFEETKVESGTSSETEKTYKITFETNGGSKVETQTVQKNQCVTEPKAPEKEGYVFGGWYTDTAFEKAYDFAAKVTAKLTLYAKWTVEKVSEEKREFTEDTYADVEAQAWYYDAVKYVHENGLMQGTALGFEPEVTLSRAMLVTMLWRLDGEKTVDATLAFEDVEAQAWYTPAVRWAVSEGIVFGKDAHLFGTDDSITREQLVTMLYRYLERKDANLPETDANVLQGFSDAQQVSAYAENAMAWAITSGILNGRGDSTLVPEDSAIRAEAAAILMRFCNL